MEGAESDSAMTTDLTVVGLTGGIASGKSTVAEIMRGAGIPVIDADGLGHMSLEPNGIAYQAVVDEFGASILGDDDRTIDRQKLGKIVFDNPLRRAALEAITHPAIGQLAGQGLHLIEQRGIRLAVYEAALLVETGIHESLEALIVVSCSLENQLTRLSFREGYSKQAAAVRIAAQLPMDEKLAVADHVIPNDGTLDELERETQKLIAVLKERYWGEVK